MIRVIDSGRAEAAAQMAESAALVEAVGRGGTPVLRFFRCAPSLLIGLHQPWPAHLPPGVAVARRPTGGGAIYVDDDQLCWDLVAPLTALNAATLAEAAARLGAAAARGLGRWARVDFTPPNSLTVGGRKLCGMAGLIDRGVTLCQASLLADGEPGQIAALSGAPTTAGSLTTLIRECGHRPDPGALKAALSAELTRLFATELAHAV